MQLQGVMQRWPDLRAADDAKQILLDFAEEIYGTDLELTFAAKLRNEQKFPDVMALQSQITGDLAAVQAPQCETAGVSAPAVCCSAEIVMHCNHSVLWVTALLE